MSDPRYHRPRLQWIKRRARKLIKFYGVNRRIAIADANRDYVDFVCPGMPPVRLVKG